MDNKQDKIINKYIQDENLKPLPHNKQYRLKINCCQTILILNDSSILPSNPAYNFLAYDRISDILDLIKIDNKSFYKSRKTQKLTLTYDILEATLIQANGEYNVNKNTIKGKLATLKTLLTNLNFDKFKSKHEQYYKPYPGRTNTINYTRILLEHDPANVKKIIKEKFNFDMKTYNEIDAKNETDRNTQSNIQMVNLHERMVEETLKLHINYLEQWLDVPICSEPSNRITDNLIEKLNEHQRIKYNVNCESYKFVFKLYGGFCDFLVCRQGDYIYPCEFFLICITDNNKYHLLGGSDDNLRCPVSFFETQMKKIDKVRFK